MACFHGCWVFATVSAYASVDLYEAGGLFPRPLRAEINDFSSLPDRQIRTSSRGRMLSRIETQTARSTRIARDRLRATAPRASSAKGSARTLHLEKPLILLHQRVLRMVQNFVNEASSRSSRVANHGQSGRRNLHRIRPILQTDHRARTCGRFTGASDLPGARTASKAIEVERPRAENDLPPAPRRSSRKMKRMFLVSTPAGNLLRVLAATLAEEPKKPCPP